MNEPMRTPPTPTPLDELADMKRQEYEQLIFTKCLWIQKQLDDLHLARQSVMGSLKGNPMNLKYLSMRASIEHDIALLQPIIIKLGGQCAKIFEQEFGVEFRFIVDNSDKKIPTPIIGGTGGIS